MKNKNGFGKVFLISSILVVIVIIIGPILIYFAFLQKNSTNEVIIEECESYEGYTKQLCYLGHAQSTGDTSICEGYFKENSDYCYKEVAITQKDSSLCEEIKDRSVDGFYEDSIYDECYTDIAKELNDIALCEKANGENNKDSCLGIIAKELLDISICDKIMDKGNDRNYYGDQCYVLVVRVGKMTDPLLCEKIESSWSKNGCYIDVAKFSGDESLCEKISDEDDPRTAESLKTDCHRNFN